MPLAGDGDGILGGRCPAHPPRPLWPAPPQALCPLLSPSGAAAGETPAKFETKLETVTSGHQAEELNGETPKHPPRTWGFHSLRRSGGPVGQTAGSRVSGHIPQRIQPSAHLSQVCPPGSPTQGSPWPGQAGSPSRLRSLAASGAARRPGGAGRTLNAGSAWP